MAFDRPQSVFSVDNTSRAHTLAFAQDVRVAGWTMVGDRKNGSGAYIMYDCVITTKEVRFCLCRWCCLCLTWLDGRIENNKAYFETVLESYMIN